jgi:hypothetical protein
MLGYIDKGKVSQQTSREEAERRLNRLPIISSGIGDLTNLPIVSGFNHLSPNFTFKEPRNRFQ